MNYWIIVAADPLLPCYISVISSEIDQPFAYPLLSKIGPPKGI